MQSHETLEVSEREGTVPTDSNNPTDEKKDPGRSANAALATSQFFSYLWLMIRKKPELAEPLTNSVAKKTCSDFPGLCSLAAGVLLWLAFPPIGWTWCAWLAPIPWLLLTKSPSQTPRRFYWKVWAGAAIHWLVMLEGIRNAHPANYLGLVAISFYLAAYTALFVAIVRRTVHRTGISLILAAPVIWTALELVRGYLFTGFSLALLGHSQVDNLWLIQIADLTGAYGVSFLVMLIAACATTVLSAEHANRRWIPLTVAATALILTSGYGWWRVRTAPDPAERPLRVALLQGNRDKVFELNRELEQKTFDQYRQLMKRARNDYADLDLIVWPESAFTELVPEYIAHGDVIPPAEFNMSADEFRSKIEFARQIFGRKVRETAAEANDFLAEGQASSGDTQLLVGVSTVEFEGDQVRQRNAAILLDKAGEIRGRYYKMHPVMFGEYIPFGKYWPWLYSLTPMREGLTPGERPAAFDVQGYRLTPSVCFESTVPHVIRSHVRELQAETGKSPDFLVNVSDDGWFWGASILDYQLACGVFRAVELRRPFLVAANTGITAAIDGSGRTLASLPRRQEGVAFAAVSPDGRYSIYEQCGDAFAALCLLATVWWGLRPKFQRGKLQAPGPDEKPSNK